MKDVVKNHGFLWIALIGAWLLLSCSSNNGPSSVSARSSNIDAGSQPLQVVDVITVAYSGSLNPDSINSDHVKLISLSDDTEVELQASYDEFAKTLFIDPIWLLNYANKYEVRVSGTKSGR